MKMNKLILKHIKHGLKLCFMWNYVYIHAPLRNLWRSRSGNCHVTILLYHRVSNEKMDNITVTPAQFIRQLSILKRDYDIIDMKNFLSDAGRWRKKTAVVISFDDGYQDNHEAAKILRKENVPATFFVSTGIIGTKNSFPMDIRLNRQLPTLSWNQVMEISSWGFHIGNHSVSHCDMGKISVENSLDEIKKATQDIAQKLGDKDAGRWFAFPFGRPRNMKNAVIEGLEKIAIDCCFSAYGGVNQQDFNRYDIARQPVSHQFSDLAFRALIEGYLVGQQQSS